MKDGFVMKGFHVPLNGEMEKINILTRRKLEADEVFVFSVVLCDNDIDRDGECFSDAALDRLATLFIGKTGIFDHSMRGRDQTARIFSCETICDHTKTTRAGAPYRFLKARAYMPRSSHNEDLILEIDAGIKKEVSVGCSIGSVRCCVCGADRRGDGCTHRKGTSYPTETGDRLCFDILDEPLDAYEWSFVAVPAQKAAGVVKAFDPCESAFVSLDMESMIKQLGSDAACSLTPSQARLLSSYVTELTKRAGSADGYLDELREEVAKLSALVQPELPREVMKSAVKKMDADELKAFQKAYETRLDQLLPARPQLTCVKNDRAILANAEFKI